MSNWNTRGRIILMALVVSVLVVPVALAKGKPPGAGKPEATGPNCKPRVSVILKGTLTAVDTGAGTLTFTVERANRHGKTLVTDPATSVTVKTNADTKIRRNGKATLADFKTSPADRVMAQLRVDRKSTRLNSSHRL